MGAGGSVPLPPRLSQKLGETTTQLQHLPPVLSAEAIEGIHVATVARNRWLAGEISKADSPTMTSARGTLVGLVRDAQRGGSFRDYLVLLLEDTRLGLLTGSRSVPAPVLELACLVNPFLSRVEADGPDPRWEGVQFASSFRPSDLNLVTESERDLLVLLYYSSGSSDHAQEAVKFVGEYVAKHASQQILWRRKEPLAETEVFLHWVIFQLIPVIAKKEERLHLPGDVAADLQAELDDEAGRLLSLCEMLLGDHRLDQLCLLLQALDKYPSRQAQPYVGSRIRRLARGMKRKRADCPTKPWHTIAADRLVDELKSARHAARETWGRKAGVRIAVGEGHSEIELGKSKKD
ncbi:hypothetical protein GQ53DRAFT_827516 [Thozetella sp. PMI_491]|nr:hypothetical protein GQ53DRAFT_827516 [Thozetella sp. PMI_491]